MANFPKFDPLSTEAQSSVIAGITGALHKLSNVLDLETASFEDVVMTEIFISNTNRHKLYQVDIDKKGWLETPTPIIKKNGIVISPITDNFVINYLGGSIDFVGDESQRPTETDVITASATYVKNASAIIKAVQNSLEEIKSKTDKNKGTFNSYDELVNSVSNPTKGDYGMVAGADGTVKLYVYNEVAKQFLEIGKETDLSGYFTKDETNTLLEKKEPTIEKQSELSTSDDYYYSGRKTWISTYEKVRTAILAGLSTTDKNAITETDTVLSALGKLQAQITTKTATITTELENLSNNKVEKIVGKGLSSNDFTNEEKSKLANLENYSLPTASETILGGVKIGANLSISADGVLNAESGGADNLADMCKVGEIIASQRIDIGEDTRFLPCDGRLLYPSSYEELSAVIKYGAGADWRQSSKDSYLFRDFVELDGDIFSATEKGIYSSYGEGRPWTPKLENISFWCLTVTSTGRIIAGGDEGIHYSDNDGRTWYKASGTNGTIKALVVTSTGRVIAGSEEGIYYSDNNGSTWTKTSQTSGYFSALAVTSTGRVIAGSNEGIYYSDNNGSTWTKTSQTSGYFSALAVTSTGRIIAGSIGRIYSSDNNGISWTSVLGVSGFVYALVVTSTGRVIAGSEEGIYYSDNDGSNWNKAFLYNVSVLALEVYEDAVIAGTDGNGIYISYDEISLPIEKAHHIKVRSER